MKGLVRQMCCMSSTVDSDVPSAGMTAVRELSEALGLACTPLQQYGGVNSVKFVVCR